MSAERRTARSGAEGVVVSETFVQEVVDAVERKGHETIDVVRELIGTPSPTGKEKDLAIVLKHEMEA